MKLAKVIFLFIPLAALSAIAIKSAFTTDVFAVAVFIIFCILSGVGYRSAPVPHTLVPASNSACVASSTLPAAVSLALTKVDDVVLQSIQLPAKE